MIDLNIDGSYKMNNKMKYFLIFFISHCFLRICTVKHNEEAPKNAQNPILENWCCHKHINQMPPSRLKFDTKLRKVFPNNLAP